MQNLGSAKEPSGTLRFVVGPFGDAQGLLLALGSRITLWGTLWGLGIKARCNESARKALYPLVPSLQVLNKADSPAS